MQCTAPDASVFLLLITGRHPVSGMALRCPDCGNELVKRIVVTRLGDIEGWYCVSCDAFFERKEIYKKIFTV
jgi:ribosomal protein L37AE/L43A